MGRALILIGLVFIAAGLLVTLGDRLPIRLGRLPGDILIRSKNSTFYFPIVTCLLASAAITLIAWLVSRFR